MIRLNLSVLLVTILVLIACGEQENREIDILDLKEDSVESVSANDSIPKYDRCSLISKISQSESFVAFHRSVTKNHSRPPQKLSSNNIKSDLGDFYENHPERGYEIDKLKISFVSRADFLTLPTSYASYGGLIKPTNKKPVSKIVYDQDFPPTNITSACKYPIESATKAYELILLINEYYAEKEIQCILIQDRSNIKSSVNLWPSRSIRYQKNSRLNQKMFVFYSCKRNSKNSFDIQSIAMQTE